MGQTLSRLLCVMGSGETAPTMVSVHQDLMARVDAPPARAILLDTPYGFEENAPSISSRAQNFFSVNVGRPIDVVPVPDMSTADSLTIESLGNAIRDAHYVFAGPGSPSYALRQWRESMVPQLLRQRLQAGGCITFASAAATTLGRVALPVYEIYKVGEPPHWLDGLGIMDAVGLPVAVLPHFDNAQGGTHDTRFCFMGERRLRILEAMLPPGVGVLGVAEHTAAIFDLDADTLSIRGRGFAALRWAGVESRFEAGQTVELGPLRAGAGSKTPLPSPLPSPDLELPASAAAFRAALDRGDATAATALVLDVEARLAGESGALSERATEQRAEFRGMLARLGAAAASGLTDPRDTVAPFVELALRLREDARRERRFADADLVRDGLIAAGIAIHDSPDGTEWSLA